MREGLMLAVAGVTIGLSGTRYATRLMTGLLAGVNLQRT
jgi:hypothetical protein